MKINNDKNKFLGGFNAQKISFSKFWITQILFLTSIMCILYFYVFRMLKEIGFFIIIIRFYIVFIFEAKYIEM